MYFVIFDPMTEHREHPREFRDMEGELGLTRFEISPLDQQMVLQSSE